MPMSQHRRAVAAILVALFAMITLAVIPVTATAQSGPTNPIVRAALSYKGQHGGQCWTFVQNIVKQATGIQMGFDYRLGFLVPLQGPGAIEVTPQDAQAGDIIQIANDANTAPDADYAGLHTSIIVNNNGDGTFDVVDSNYNFDETVTEHDGYNPAESAARYGLEFHIYRFSTDGAALAPAQASSEPIGKGDTVVVRTAGDVLNLRPVPSTQQAPIAKLANGTLLTVTGDSVTTAGGTWVPVRTASGQTGWVSTDWIVRAPEASTSGAAPLTPVFSFHVVVPMVVTGN
jgi:hypothetical protein